MISAARLRFASRIAGIHFVLSILIAALLAALVFFVWYPHPYRALMGSFKLFWLVVSVDVICGPLLTFILADPKKKRREMILDFSLVAAIQLSAFVYGLHSVYEARPVAVVFEVDRLRALAKTDIYEPELPQAPEGYQKLPIFGIWQLAARSTTEGSTIEDVNLSLQGFDIGQRPSWWIPYTDAKEAMQQRAKPLQVLIVQVNDAQKALLETTAKRHQAKIDELWYLPLTSPSSTEWTAILDKEMNILDAVPLDAFR